MNENGPEKCIWYNNNIKNISKLIPYYEISRFNYNQKFFNSIQHSKSKTYKNENFQILKTVKDPEEYKKHLIKLKNVALEKNINKKDSTIKSITTKYNRLIENHNNIIKTQMFQIYPTEEQKIVIFNWMNECVKVYNKSIDMYNNNELNLNYMVSKLVVFNKLYNNVDKNAPYDMLTNEVQVCCSNIKSCLSNLNNNNIKFFNMKHKNTSRGQSVLIPKKAVNSKGFFTSILGNMEGFENIDAEIIDCDSRLIYDKIYNRFYLKCPMYFNKINVNKRKSIVALDPGEKIFMSYYSLNNCGHIGDNFRDRIKEIQVKIKRVQRDIKKRLNRKKLKLKNVNKLKKKLRSYYDKIKNIVKELHNKTALYLVRHYDTVLIPEFKTQDMVKCFGKKFIKDKVKEIKNTLKEEEQKQEFRKYTKIKRLSKERKFTLNSLSHYRFRQHLEHKGKEYGCEIKVVTEEYTSKCCSKCGILSEEYNNRVKNCKFCGLKIDRDINGSRNILIKNNKDNFKIPIKKCMSTEKTT